jgi:hypothetical protein
MKITIKTYLLLAFCFLLSMEMQAQSGKTYRVNSYGVNMTFADGRSKIKSTDLASNVLRIVNNTKKDMELTLQISPPAGWKIFGKQEIKISLKAKDSTFVPVRVRPMYNIKGNTNYVVNAFLSSEQFTITNSIWYISVDKLSHWNVYTPENKVYFTGNSDTAEFKVRISNGGNSDENLMLELHPEKDLEIINKGISSRGANSYPIFLKVGQDTTITFSARMLKAENLPLNTGDQEDDLEGIRPLRVKIRVKNERPASQGSSKLWTGNIDFVDLPDRKKVMDAGIESLPMTVEFNTFDVMTESTFSALNVYGSKKYDNNSIFTYYYQADFVQNQINLNSYLGNYLYLSYFHKRFSLELGDIGSNRPGSTLNGKGIKAALNFKGNRLGGIFIRKPKLFNQYYAEGFGGFHTFRNKRLFVDNYYQHINNNWRKVSGDFATTDWNVMIRRGHILRVGAGYSLDNHYWTPGEEKTVTGYGWKLGYAASFRKLNVNVNSYYGSKSYTPMRGSFSLSGSARYRLTKEYSLSASAYKFSFNPTIYNFGEIANDSIYNIQDNYSLKLNYQKNQNVFIFQPKYYTIQSNSISTRTRGMAFEYRRLSRSAFKFYVNFFAGYSRFDRNPELNDIFVSYVQTSMRYNRLQFNTRYYYGPYYTVEQIQYVTDQVNPQRVFTTLFYDYWFMKNKMRLNVNLNYFYTTIHDRKQFITRPELFYYAEGGFRFSIYARYSFFGEGQYTRNQYNAGSGNYTEQIVEASKFDRFEIGAGVKFNVNMPTGFKRYYKVKVVAFRDLNGNGVMDPGEKGIENMLIMLTKNDTVASVDNTQQDLNQMAQIHELVTNGKGYVEYENIPVGEYVIKAKPLTSMGGWFDGKTFYRTVDKNKTIYIPLSKGARISGGVLMERAKFTDNKPVFLGNIRVTAIHTENGKSFSTLTDKDGQFVLFAPNGSYRIVINEEAVGSRFEFLQNDVPLTITKDFENYNVSFYLVEKERQIRMSGSRRKPNAPINRENGNTGSSDSDENTPQGGVSPVNYMPVDSVQANAKKFVVVLYSQPRGREELSQFDAANSLTQIKCIATKTGGYQYISVSFDKEKKAKKLSQKLKQAGYPEAHVQALIFD